MKAWSNINFIALPSLERDGYSKNYLLERFINAKTYFDELDLKYPLNNFVKSIKKLDFLFVSAQYKDIILYLNNLGFEIGILGNEEDLQFCLKHNLHYIPYFFILKKIREAFEYETKKQIKEINKLRLLVANLFKMLNLKYLILYNDETPLERFLISLKTLVRDNIKLIIIQHGLFFKKYLNKKRNKMRIFFTAKNIDYYFTYGEYFSNLFNEIIGTNLRANRVFIPFGFPKKLHCQQSKNGKKIIGFLGQPYELFDEFKARKKKEILQKIYKIFKNNFEIYYKPHPQEIRHKLYPKNIKVFKGSLDEFFQITDIILGIDSTALLEASICKKIAFQIYSPIFGSENFEKLGISYSLSDKELHKLPLMLNKKPFEIRSTTVKILPEPGKEFLNLLNFKLSNR